MTTRNYVPLLVTAYVVREQKRRIPLVTALTGWWLMMAEVVFVADGLDQVIMKTWNHLAAKKECTRLNGCYNLGRASVLVNL